MDMWIVRLAISQPDNGYKGNQGHIMKKIATTGCNRNASKHVFFLKLSLTDVNGRRLKQLTSSVFRTVCSQLKKKGRVYGSSLNHTGHVSNLLQSRPLVVKNQRKWTSNMAAVTVVDRMTSPSPVYTGRWIKWSVVLVTRGLRKTENNLGKRLVFLMTQLRDQILVRSHLTARDALSTLT